MKFELHSEFQPTGDQPKAIQELVDGFRAGNQFETLVGVTGSGYRQSACRSSSSNETTRSRPLDCCRT